MRDWPSASWPITKLHVTALSAPSYVLSRSLKWSDSFCSLSHFQILAIGALARLQSCPVLTLLHFVICHSKKWHRPQLTLF